ncbi:leucine-rich repeat domain-containing protein [Rubritalea tangerina]|uniref:Leucine-rich repeat protein n=1 Tax=Rubritalea tangerina TaxID=430798 RepID=A0ABW4ZEI0_9BACT
MTRTALRLSALLSLTLASLQAASVSDLTYTSDGSGITITDCLTSATGAMDIPATIDGLPVVKIASRAFQSCNKITSMTMPNTITSIGSYCFFNCDLMETIQLSTGLSTIATATFRSCDSLDNVVIPEGVLKLGSYAFFGADGMTSVSLPSSLTSIGNDAFDYCQALESIEIPAGVSSLPSRLFENCILLSNITLNEGLQTIKAYAFLNCQSLTSLSLPSTVSNIEAAAFDNASALVSVSIHPNNTTYASNGGSIVSNNLTTLEHVTEGTSGSYTIPFSVTSIASTALDGCDKITTLTLNSAITTFTSSYLSGCNSLTSIQVEIGNTTFSSTGGVLFNLDATELIAYPRGLTGAYTIPEGVTSIANSAFNNCDQLSSIQFASTLIQLAPLRSKAVTALLRRI